MMKPITYKTLRRIIFTVYVLFAVLFCFILIHLGKKEIERARKYAEREKRYFESLLTCRECLNNVEKSFSLFIIDQGNNKLATTLLKNVTRLRDSVTDLTKDEKGRIIPGVFSATQIKDETRLIHSIAHAIVNDCIDTTISDRKNLIREDIVKFQDVLHSLREKTQRLLRNELNHVEIWQRQSVFFYNRLQYLLVVFFILTILFSVSASMLFSYILKRSLYRLSDGARELSSGNLKFRFDKIQDDETGGVMRDFNTMASRLEKQTEALYKANRELQKNAEQLIEAHQHKDRFLANMSHELRTPLNSVIGFSELLIKRANTIEPEVSIKYAERILAAAEHLLELISDLLQVAKVDAGVLKPVFTEFNLSACIDEVNIMLSPLAEQKQLTLKSDYPNEMPLRADKRLIRQVLINLINNAIKFTNEGTISVKVEILDNEYRVDVVDTGIGISEEDQKSIFTDFHRVEQGLTSNYEGVGLGLTLSKKLIELHHGKINVSSVLDEGTVFSIYLPIKSQLQKSG